jgi:hypothetical protein
VRFSQMADVSLMTSVLVEYWHVSEIVSGDDRITSLESTVVFIENVYCPYLERIDVSQLSSL